MKNFNIDKFFISVIILMIIFFIGMYCGKMYTIHHQEITATDNGYQVELDYNYYTYE